MKIILFTYKNLHCMSKIGILPVNSIKLNTEN